MHDSINLQQQVTWLTHERSDNNIAETSSNCKNLPRLDKQNKLKRFAIQMLPGNMGLPQPTGLGCGGLFGEEQPGYLLQKMVFSLIQQSKEENPSSNKPKAKGHCLSFSFSFSMFMMGSVFFFFLSNNEEDFTWRFQHVI